MVMTDKQVIVCMLVLAILSFVVGVVSTEMKNKNSFTNGMYYGLDAGFEQGFISGQQYQLGKDIGYNLSDVRAFNQTWYVHAGMYDVKDNLNPYRIYGK